MNGMEELVAAVLGMLFVSGLCSATEAALFSVPLAEIRELANNNHATARVLLEIRERMNRPITTVVILNNLANIGGSLLVGRLAMDALGSRAMGAFSAALTLAVIVCAEIVPKTIGEQHARAIALLAARPVRALTCAGFPLVWCLEQMMRPFMGTGDGFTTNEAEIKLLARIGRTEGAIEEAESAMIHRVFDLNDCAAADIMTPRVVMTALEGRKSLAESGEEIRNSQHSRIVVVDESPDAIMGIAMKTELLQAMIDGRGEEPVANFLHEALFVPETKSADSLLLFFREHRQHLAVVIDEYGGVSGVVALEDALEVLTGEIVDETDRVADLQEAARRRHARMRPAEQNQ